MKEHFLSLYDEYYPKIYSYILVRVRHKELAEDITQQAFLKALKSVDSYRPKKGAHVGSWLFRIATNVMHDHFRKNDITLNEDAHVHLEVIDLLDPAAILEERGNAQKTCDDWRKIMEAINTLSDIERMVLTLKYLSAFSYQEISELTGKKPNTLAVILKRSLEKIRKQVSYEES